MSEHKTEATNEKPSTPPASVTATVENRDASGTLLGRQRLKMESEFGNTPQGMLANIWAKLGMLAAVTIAFFGMMAWFAYTVNAQVDAAREEAREVRQAAEKERKDAVDRYIASRVANDARHAEVLAKLDKISMFVDMWFKYIAKETPAKGTFSAVPKIEMIK